MEGRTRDASNIASPGYIYASILAKPQQCQSGSQINDALNLLKDHGSLSLRDFAYSDKSCNAPSPQQQEHATDFRIRDWLAVDFHDPDQVKAELAKGHPVIFALIATKAFHHLRAGEIYSFTGDGQGNGHAITLTGYDERMQAFKFINSWGRNWADNGFGWISYDSFKSQVNEAFVMRPVQPEPPAPRPTPHLHTPTPNVVVVKPEVHPTPEPRPTPSVVQGGCKTETIVTAPAEAKADASSRPWPQCEVLQTLHTALANGERPSVAIAKGSQPASDKQFIQFSVVTPAYPSFLHVTYIQADGSVVNLVQSSNDALRTYAPGTKLTFGDLKGDGPKFEVSGPFGREMLVVVASRSPLFANELKQRQTDREFLTELRKAVIAKPSPDAADRQISAAYDTIVTTGTEIIYTDRPTR